VFDHFDNSLWENYVLIKNPLDICDIKPNTKNVLIQLNSVSIKSINDIICSVQNMFSLEKLYFNTDPDWSYTTNDYEEFNKAIQNINSISLQYLYFSDQVPDKFDFLKNLSNLKNLYVSLLDNNQLLNLLDCLKQKQNQNQIMSLILGGVYFYANQYVDSLFDEYCQNNNIELKRLNIY
jgi:hypothetical protein